MDFEDYGYTMQGGKSPKEATQGAFKTENVTWSSELFEPLERVFTKLDRPVLFEDGVGAILDNNQNNHHVFPILKADEASFSYNRAGPVRGKTALYSGN